MRWGRTLTLALPLLVLNAGWIAHSEMRTGVTEITITTLFMGVALVLFLLTLLNQGVRRLFPRAALRPAEMFCLYVLLTIGTSVAGIGNFGFFAPFLVGIWRYGPERSWERLYDTLPERVLGPGDPARLKAFYEGRSTFFTPDTIAAWAPALLFWGVFFTLLCSVTLCLAFLLRRRWADEEYLTFPVVALPLELCHERAPILSNKLFWAGFAAPALLYSLNTLSGLYPSLPSLPFNKSVELMEGAPYPVNGLGTVQLLVHPVGIGFGFLVNADVLFSLWFFWALKKALNLWGTTLNWRDPGPDTYNDRSEQFPFVQYQAWGAWLVVCLAALWTARRYVGALPTQRGARLALAGAGIGLALLWAMLLSVGAPWWLPPLFLLLYLLIHLSIARLEAETAVLSPLLMWVDPHSMITTIAGTASLSRGDLAHMATLSWFNLDYRAAMLAQQTQGFVGMKRLGGSLRPFALACLLATVVGVFAAILWDMQLYHTLGAGTANVNAYRINMGNLVWTKLAGWVSQPEPPDGKALLAAAIGAGLTVLLGVLRMRFVGFPLSPSAFVLNLSWANELFWLDLFLAWCFKASFLRYGGIKLYRAALPFFLGLILGDFVTGALWSLLGLALGVEVYRTFPN